MIGQALQRQVKEVTATTRNNDRGINDRSAREADCNKVGTTTISKFQQKIIPILFSFRGGNLKNYSTKWKNATSDKFILGITENRPNRPNRY